ncbi:MAG: hypothetical protein H6728_09495 [Myxococcales bacterium]|nr:hypothetical protein [Myxococcales bacterium]
MNRVVSVFSMVWGCCLFLWATSLAYGSGVELTGSLPSTPSPDYFGTRPMGMGNAGVALADGPESLFLNPAGAWRRRKSYVLQGTFFFHPAADNRVFNVGIIDSKSNPMVAGGISYSYYVAPRNDDGKVRTVEGHIARLGVAAAFQETLVFGATLKYLYLNRPFFLPINTLTLDVGVTWQANNWLSLSVVGYNLIYNETGETPISMAVGFAIGYKMPLQLAVDWVMDFQSKGNGEVGHELRVGAEYTIANIVAIRVGYQLDQVRDFLGLNETERHIRHFISAGVGVKYAQFGAQVAFRQQLALNYESNNRQLAFSLQAFF